MADYEVMAYRALRGEVVAGEGDIVTLPTGWVPLSAVAENDYVAILCYRQTDPGPGGAAPTIDSLTPSTLSTGGPPETVDVLGSGFVSGCTITLDDLARATFFLDDTHLQYTARPDLTAKGIYTVKVVNPDDSVSNGVVFTYT